MGGTLNVISNEGWEHLDPGASYFQIDYVVVYATQRPLYTFTPTSNKPVPLLASGPPQISADGKTVTVHIKSGFKFSAPVNRAVTSADVAYAFQRMFNPNVQNGYAAGTSRSSAPTSPGQADPGISTPNKTTIVFHLTKNFGATMAEALTLPGTAPVPEDYAAKFDKSSPSKYDSDPTIQAFTGPYIIKSYSAGRSVTLVRNPVEPDGRRRPSGVRGQDRVERRRRPVRRRPSDARQSEPDHGRCAALVGSEDRLRAAQVAAVDLAVGRQVGVAKHASPCSTTSTYVRR